MKKQDWTRLAEVAFGILATEAIVFALLIYALKEPNRLENAQSEILATQLDEAMSLYAENCTVCHGMAGEGIGSTPALNNEGLRTMDYDELLKVINRGRYDTAMPAWNKSDGGPLSDYQVEELAELIQFGDWQETQNRVVNLGLAPLVPFSTEPDPVLYDSLAALEDGETLQQAITIFSSECVACHGADGLGTSLAPPLNDPALRETPADELNRIISLGVSGTLMAGWNSSLTPEEINALVTLISRWDEVELGAIPAPEVPIVTTEESLLLGEALYASNCSMCHGPEGQGTRRAPALNVRGFLTDTPDQAIQQIIMQGVPGTAMPAWGDRMLESDIQAIVGFIRQWEATAPEVASPAMMGRGGRGGGGGPPWANGSNWTPPGMSGGGELTQEELDALRAAEEAARGNQDNATRPSERFGEEDGMHEAGGGIPPWAQEMEEPAWWERLDIRTWTLILGASALALVLIVIGYTALRRLPPADDAQKKQ